jgi:hypothetical protein
LAVAAGDASAPVVLELEHPEIMTTITSTKANIDLK